MAEDTNRRYLLAARPVGEIQVSDFELSPEPVPEPGESQILCRNLYLSLDPAMRGWMNDTKSYVPPVPLGGVMRGGTIGRVVNSNHPDYSKGDTVIGAGGWQDYSVFGPKGLPRKLPDDSPLPLTTFMSVLGGTGLTAYFGLLDITDPQQGETVVVSTAAGAVGSIAGQIAKIKGCRVVGITGSDEKCAWITRDLGFEAAVNYKTQDVVDSLRETCPDGIDVYFDNVGGEILNAVLGQINFGARVSICGAISRYNKSGTVPGPSNYIALLTKSAKMEGFIVSNYSKRFTEAVTQLSEWLMEGKLEHKEDIVEGLENAPRAMGKLFDGSNDGKLIIKIADE